jgi:hypothetical protein
LRRLGEGIGKVVYASDHWVVKRERSNSEVVALIAVWKLLRRVESVLPGGLGQRLVQRPARQIRLLRVIMQGLLRFVPRSVWFMSNIGEVLQMYTSRDAQGEQLAREYLTGTSLMPETVRFPPVKVRVGGWPGWLEVSEATERVEATLYQRVVELARAGRWEDVEYWLNRFLDTRQAGWRCGVFSVDAHLKNFGVAGERVVLLDPGGLTNCLHDIEKRLRFEEAKGEPHVRLGLRRLLNGRPDIAARFNERWRATVNVERILQNWPGEPAA